MNEEINKIQLKDEIALFDERNKLLSTLPTLTAVTDENANEIGKLVKSVDTYCKKVKNERLGLTRKLDALKKAFMDKERELTDQLLEWKNNALQLTAIYATEKERARLEAEKERARLEAEAEIARQEAEEKAQKEAEKEAEIASMFGNTATAPTEEPPKVEPPPQIPLPPKVEKPIISNVRQVKVARWNITDASKLPREFLSVDETKIRAFANDKLKAGIDLKSIQIDGIDFFEEVSAQVR